jgi:DNA-binding CsgD family transcriptional regulator
MADATLYCKTCGDYKEHMHLGGRDCICSECGEKNAAPNWREIEAAVEKRKAANQAAVAGRNAVSAADLGMTTTSQEQKDRIATRYLAGESAADLAKEYGVSGKTVRGYVAYARQKARAAETNAAPAETPAAETETETPKEKTMKTKLTDEKIAEIRADYAGLLVEERTRAAVLELAKKHGISEPTFRKYVRLMDAKPAKAGRPGRKGAKAKRYNTENLHVRVPRQEGRKPEGFKAALSALVEAAVEARLADLEALVKAEVAKSVSITESDLDGRVEAALARALK